VRTDQKPFNGTGLHAGERPVEMPFVYDDSLLHITIEIKEFERDKKKYRISTI